MTGQHAFIDWLSNHHKKVLIPALLCTLASLVALFRPGLHEEYTIASFIGSRNPEFDRFQLFVAEFSSSELTLVAVKDGGVSEPETQDCLNFLVDQLEKQPAVYQVSAVSRIPRLLRSRLMESPLIKGTLISEDGKTAAVVVQMRGEAESGDVRTQTVTKLREIVAQTRARYPHMKIVLTGPYVTTFEMFEYVRKDLAVFSIIVAALMLVTLYLVMGRWSTAAFAIGVGASATLCTLGFTIAGVINTSLTTQMIVIMVSILAVATCVHIAAAYRETADELHRDIAAVNSTELAAAALRNIFWPCTAVILTSAAGFAAVTISSIKPIRQFGLLMVLGLMLALILAFAAVFLLPRLPAGTIDPRSALHRRLADMLETIARASLARRVMIIALFACLTVLLVIPIPSLRFESDFVKNFRKDSSVRAGYEFVERNLAPLNSIELVVRSKDQKSVINLQVLKACDQVAQQAVSMHDPIKKSISIVDVLKLIFEELPDSEAQLQRQYIAAEQVLQAAFGKEVLANFVTPDLSALRISLRAREGIDVWQKIDIAGQVHDRAQTAFGVGYDVELTGLYYFYATLIAGLLRDQNITFCITLLIIFLMTAVFIKSWKLAAVAMVPNLFPMIACVGLMGWLQIPINMVTSMMLSISLGIAVDDTIHYLWRFRREYQRDGDTEAALVRTHRSVGRACVFTTIVIAGGFWVLCFSRFLPLAYFGALIGLTMLAALAADLILLPVLLIIFKPISAAAVSRLST